MTRRIALSCCQLADVAAAILGDINLVAIVDHLNGRQSDTGLGPQTSEHDFLLSGRFSSRLPQREVLVVPRIHRGSLDGLLTGKDLALSCGGHMFPLKGFFVSTVVNTTGTSKIRVALARATALLMIGLPVEVRGSEQHLGLMVDDNGDDAIVGRVNRPSHYALRDRCFETRLSFLSRSGS